MATRIIETHAPPVGQPKDTQGFHEDRGHAFTCTQADFTIPTLIEGRKQRVGAVAMVSGS